MELQPEKALFECLPGTFKKLVLVSATSSSVTETSKEDDMTLKRVPCVHYPLRFQKDTADIGALIDSGSEVNAITPAYASKLGLRICHTNVEAQKIYSSTSSHLK